MGVFGAICTLWEGNGRPRRGMVEALRTGRVGVGSRGLADDPLMIVWGEQNWVAWGRAVLPNVRLVRLPAGRCGFGVGVPCPYQVTARLVLHRFSLGGCRVHCRLAVRGWARW